MFDKTNECVRNFVKLFIIDRGAIDTMSKDETSRKIAIALQKKELDERRRNGEKITMKEKNDIISGTSMSGKCGDYNLRRLDSMHLNALTSKAFKKKDRPQSSPTKIKRIADDEDLDSPLMSQYSSPSPLKNGRRLDLDAISEKDSLCTDSSFIASESFVSAQRHREWARKDRTNFAP